MECSHYRMIADEAYKQLMEIQGRGILSRSLDVQLRDWLELMEEVGLAVFCLIQTCGRLKWMLFIVIRKKGQIFGAIPFFKLQNNT